LFLTLTVKPGIQWQILNENISQKLPLSGLFLGLNILQKLRIFSKQQVPHSQYLLSKNRKFSQNFRSKNNTLKEKFCLISAIGIQAKHSKVNTITLVHIIVCIS
jgi:hypothetical protein